MLQGHEQGVLYAAFSPDGKRVVTASMDRTLRVCDTVSGKQLAKIEMDKSEDYSVGFSPDGQFIISAGSGEENL